MRSLEQSIACAYKIPDSSNLLDSVDVFHHARSRAVIVGMIKSLIFLNALCRNAQTVIYLSSQVFSPVELVFVYNNV